MKIIGGESNARHNQRAAGRTARGRSGLQGSTKIKGRTASDKKIQAMDGSAEIQMGGVGVVHKANRVRHAVHFRAATGRPLISVIQQLRHDLGAIFFRTCLTVFLPLS
jgi:hypothetical protein